MSKISSVAFPEFLERKFLDWQSSHGRRKTIEEFAEYLGVSRPLLNMWMNGNRKPGKESLELLSIKLGNEVYDIAGLPRPNIYLQVINRIFERIPPEAQRKLAEDAARYQTDDEQDERTKTTHRKRKTPTHK